MAPEDPDLNELAENLRRIGDRLDAHRSHVLELAAAAIRLRVSTAWAARRQDLAVVDTRGIEQLLGKQPPPV